jgi:hypothetical protein
MNKLRHHIIYLILFFFTLFVLLYGGYVFGFALLSLFTVLLISAMVTIDLLTVKTKMWTQNMVWLAAYGFYLVWLLLGSGMRIAESMQSVYRIFTEMFFISVGLTISRRISDYLDEAHTVFKEITYAHLSPPKPLNEVIYDFEVEINRSLRYQRPLAMLVIDVVPHLESATSNDPGNLGRLQREMLEGYFNSRVGHELSKLSRNTDLIAATEKIGLFFMVCPETDKRSIAYLADRINIMVEEHFEATMHWGASEVNSRTTNFSELLEIAELDLENRSVNPQIRFERDDQQMLPYLQDQQTDDSAKAQKELPREDSSIEE